MFYHISFLM